MRFLRRTWAEIDLDALARNFSIIKETAGNAGIMAVVKADAYGHGAPAVAERLCAEGARMLGVSNIEEALQLREHGITTEILIFGYTPSSFVPLLAKQNLTQTVYCAEYAHALAAAALAAGVSLDVQIKVDTGMSRLGFDCHDRARADRSICEIAELTKLSVLNPRGLYTHFPSADFDGDNDGSFTEMQAELLDYVVEQLSGMNIVFEQIHCCNSAGTAAHGGLCHNIVRTGLSLYGISPDKRASFKGLEPVMQLKSVIAMIKELKAGDTLSYGRTFTAYDGMKVATVPIGYADGYSRSLSNKAHMLVNGRRAPVVGRICMDQLLLDVTDIPDAVAGGTVTVFGSDCGEHLDVEEISAISDTISYETLCLVGKRVPRLYYSGGQIVGQQNYLAR